MRDDGVSAFPDPDASGELTIDAIANGSSLDPNGAAFEKAMSACKDLQPPGFTGHKRSAQSSSTPSSSPSASATTACRTSRTPPTDGPLVDTTHIPSTERDGGMSVLNAAMQKCAAFSDKLGVKRR